MSVPNPPLLFIRVAFSIGGMPSLSSGSYTPLPRGMVAANTSSSRFGVELTKTSTAAADRVCHHHALEGTHRSSAKSRSRLSWPSLSSEIAVRIRSESVGRGPMRWKQTRSMHCRHDEERIPKKVTLSGLGRGDFHAGRMAVGTGRLRLAPSNGGFLPSKLPQVGR